MSSFKRCTSVRLSPEARDRVLKEFPALARLRGRVRAASALGVQLASVRALERSQAGLAGAVGASISVRGLRDDLDPQEIMRRVNRYLAEIANGQVLYEARKAAKLTANRLRRFKTGRDTILPELLELPPGVAVSPDELTSFAALEAAAKARWTPKPRNNAWVWRNMPAEQQAAWDVKHKAMYLRHLASPEGDGQVEIAIALTVKESQQPKSRIRHRLFNFWRDDRHFLNAENESARFKERRAGLDDAIKDERLRRFLAVLDSPVAQGKIELARRHLEDAGELGEFTLVGAACDPRNSEYRSWFAAEHAAIVQRWGGSGRHRPNRTAGVDEIRTTQRLYLSLMCEFPSSRRAGNALALPEPTAPPRHWLRHQWFRERLQLLKDRWAKHLEQGRIADSILTERMNGLPKGAATFVRKLNSHTTPRSFTWYLARFYTWAISQFGHHPGYIQLVQDVIHSKTAGGIAPPDDVTLNPEEEQQLQRLRHNINDTWGPERFKGGKR